MKTSEIKTKAPYPQYYMLDDIPVVIWADSDTDVVYCVNDLGNPKNLAEVYMEGHVTTEEEFHKAAAERKRTLKPSV